MAIISSGMKTILTGPTGQVGHELLACWPPDQEIIPLGSGEMDLANADSIRSAIRRIKPDLIVNAAAYTAVDRAEDEPELAHAINGAAVGIIGEEAQRIGAAVVHYSTDYVFDGVKTTPYAIDDRPNPQSVYGRSKLEGELALAASGAAHLTIRTSWIYGLRGRNFLLAILRQAALKPELKIVADQIGSPTWCRVVARTSVEMIFGSLGGNPGARNFSNREGLYHLTCGGATNWFEFASRILEVAALQNPPKLTPISTIEYGARATRPLYSVLDCSRTVKTFGVLIVDWASALEELLIGQRAQLPAIMSQ